MQNQLWADIQAQGENLEHVVEHLYTTERERIERAAAFLRNDRPLALIGVASAEYVCMPAEIYLGQRGRYASVMCASDALYSLLPALREANVVVNTRSGETAEIVKLGQALREHGIPFVTVTNEPESRLARLASQVVWADTRKDDLVSINVVTGMMTATLALAAAVTGEFERLRSEFERLAGEMRGVVARAAEQASAVHALLGGVRPVYLLYRGHSKGAAYCGRLVLEEVSRTPGIAMESAEFRQGPNEVIDERFGAVVFAPSGKQGELNLALARDILRSGGRALLVGQLPEDALAGQSGSLVFPIPDVPDCLAPVLEVVPVQCLAYELAKAQGYSPGEVRYITKVILSEEGIPRAVSSDL
jgi:glucosamine--fructose-6-phosphate aminotransferase (isomerizing)